MRRWVGLGLMALGVGLLSSFGPPAVELQIARFQAQASLVISPLAGIPAPPITSADPEAQTSGAAVSPDSGGAGGTAGAPSGRMPEATWMRIPAIGVDSRVVELGVVWKDDQWVWETPKFAVGHHRGTANVGEVGNAVFSGHISSPLSREGSVFSELPKLKVGEEVEVESRAGTFTYRVVDRAIVEPSRVEVMDPTPDQTLTLITCYPDLVYTQRLVITAKLVDAAISEPSS